VVSRYRAVAAHIGSSCYNCSHFQLDETMLKGRCCHLNKTKGALGTCEHFLTKSGRTPDGRLPSIRSLHTVR